MYSVMVNGLDTKEGLSAARKVQESAEFELIGESMIKSGVQQGEIYIGKKEVVLFSEPKILLKELKRLRESFRNIIVVDFSPLACLQRNAELYTKACLNFIMSVEGLGIQEKKRIRGIVCKSGVLAVLTPKQAYQVILELLYRFGLRIENGKGSKAFYSWDILR